MYNSVVSSKFTDLHNHHKNPVLEHFHHPRNNSPAPLQPIPFFTPAQETTDLIALSINLPFLDGPCQWNDTIGGLLCLVSFTEGNVLEVCSCCSMCQ